MLALAPYRSGISSQAGTITLANHATLQAATLDTSFYSTPNIGPTAQLTIDPTSSFEVGTAGGAAAGALTVDAGQTVALIASVHGALVNNGSITMKYQLTAPGVTGPIGGAGQITLQQGFPNGTASVMTIADAVGAAQTIALSGTLTVNLNAPASFAGTFAGLAADQTIELPAAITSVGYSQGAGSGTISLFAGATPAGTLAVAGFYLNGFTLTPVSGGANLTAAPCFAAGTRIRTRQGEVPVEALAIGDIVVSPAGRHVPIVWLGHRRVDCRHHVRPGSVWPVRVAADALADGVPARDLWLSPEHAVFLHDVLVPVRCLINGATIRQVPRPEVTYWHVELPAHGLLLAEGMPVESYLDTGNRADFSNAGAAVTLHPDFANAAWAAHACVPQLRHGKVLASIYDAVAQRAARLGYFLTAEMRAAAG